MVYIEVQDKKTQVWDEKKMSYKLFHLIGTQSIESHSIGTQLVIDRSKVTYQQKINKCKKPITWPFEAQIASQFFQYLKDIIS